MDVCCTHEVNKLGVEPAASTRVHERLPGLFKNEFHAANQTLAVNDAASAHRVRPGETLSGICLDTLRQLGRPVDRQAIYAAVQQVARANGLRNADLIMPGQDLDLSVLQPIKPAPRVQISANQDAGPVPPLIPVIPETRAALAPLTDRPVPVQATIPARPQRAREAMGGPRFRPENVAAPRVPETPRRSEEAGPWQRILARGGILTSEFGVRDDPFNGAPDFHKGIDIAAPKGTPIRSYKEGQVMFSGWQTGYGNVVIVRHDDGLESLYAHTQKNLVKVGERIDSGATVALVGSSGRSTGPHLHFEVRRNGTPIDPIPVLQASRLQVAEAF